MILPDIILTPLKCNELIQTISKSYKVPKKNLSIKEAKKWEGTKNVRNPHILRTLVNFFVFLDFDFFSEVI